MSSKNYFFVLSLIAFTLIFGSQSTSATNKQRVVITGSIKNASAFSHQGKFQNEAVHFWIDNWLFDQAFSEIPTDLGDFKFMVDISQPTPAKLKYGDYTIQMFWTPGDQLHITFDGDRITETIKYTGKGAIHNNFFAAFDRNFNTQNFESKEDRQKSSNLVQYRHYSKTLKAKEELFLNNYINKNPTSSIDFKKWAKTDIFYRSANRIHERYFEEEPQPNDGYSSFIQQFPLNNEAALMSNQYLFFLDNHLRQLCLRDSKKEQMARRQRRELWPYRGYELSQTAFRGAVKEHAQAKLIMSLIEAKEVNSKRLFDNFTATATDTGLKKLVRKKYAELATFLNAPPPSNANLVVLKNGEKTSIEALLQKYRGKVIYIDFWASWCKPCLAEMRYTPQLKQRYKGKDVAFVYFSADDTEGPWRANVARFGLKGDHYLMSEDFKSATYKSWRVGGLPRYVIVDRNGNIANASAASPSKPAAFEQIDRVLNR